MLDRLAESRQKENNLNYSLRTPLSQYRNQSNYETVQS